jgi:hypothetical protein
MQSKVQASESAAAEEPGSMNERMVKLPVRCPRCGKQALNELPLAEVASALIQHNSIHLYADCHKIAWTTGKSEEQQIREYLASTVNHEDI